MSRIYLVCCSMPDTRNCCENDAKQVFVRVECICSVHCATLNATQATTHTHTNGGCYGASKCASKHIHQANSETHFRFDDLDVKRPNGSHVKYLKREFYENCIVRAKPKETNISSTAPFVVCWQCMKRSTFLYIIHAHKSPNVANIPCLLNTQPRYSIYFVPMLPMSRAVWMCVCVRRKATTLHAQYACTRTHTPRMGQHECHTMPVAHIQQSHTHTHSRAHREQTEKYTHSLTCGTLTNKNHMRKRDWARREWELCI